MKITFAPTAESKSAADAAAKLAESVGKINAALSARVKLGEHEITESGKSVSAVRRDGKTVYIASVRIQVTLKASDEKIGGVTEAAESLSVQWHTEYLLADKSYADKLAAEAVAKAKASAESIAAAAGVKLGTLASVEYAASFGGSPRMLRAVAAESGATHEPEPIEAVESVTCEWEIQ